MSEQPLSPTSSFWSQYTASLPSSPGLPDVIGNEGTVWWWRARLAWVEDEADTPCLPAVMDWYPDWPPLAKRHLVIYSWHLPALPRYVTQPRPIDGKTPESFVEAAHDACCPREVIVAWLEHTTWNPDDYKPWGLPHQLPAYLEMSSPPEESFRSWRKRANHVGMKGHVLEVIWDWAIGCELPPRQYFQYPRPTGNQTLEVYLGMVQFWGGEAWEARNIYRWFVLVEYEQHKLPVGWDPAIRVDAEAIEAVCTRR